MKAAVYEEFGGPLSIQQVADPVPDDHGVVIEVRANGMCLSDWHAWKGHDPDVRLPHVPGHELAGLVASTGKAVSRWKTGDRVTLPFVCACGTCPQCAAGHHQVCDHQEQPGFTHWGSYAQYVAIARADTNLVQLPERMDFVTAASLGCRFATSFRALTAQGRVSAGQWVAVHGCGGVGLSAIMIASALGAQVIGVDIHEDRLEFARAIGACATVNASSTSDVVAEVVEISHGGAHVSIDALGNPQTCFNSIASLRKRGRHVQVGLMLADHSRPQIPMDLVVAKELEILGSHGMQAHLYDGMLEMILAGKLQPDRLIGKRVSLEESLQEFIHMDLFQGAGITVIDSF